MTAIINISNLKPIKNGVKEEEECKNSIPLFSPNQAEKSKIKYKEVFSFTFFLLFKALLVESTIEKFKKSTKFNNQVLKLEKFNPFLNYMKIHSKLNTKEEFEFFLFSIWSKINSVLIVLNFKESTIISAFILMDRLLEKDIEIFNLISLE